MLTHIKSLCNQFAPHFNQGAKIIAWFFIPTGVLIFLLHALLTIAHPFSLDYGEAPLINQAMNLVAGENIYRPSLETPPFTIANYPPVYVLTLVPFLNVFETPFQAGRLISVISSLASALFLGLIHFKFTRDRFGAILTGAIFLSFPYVVEWSGRARIDSLALGLATAALFVLVWWPKSRLSFFGGALLLVAAAYTRQSYLLAAPLAAFVWLWSQDKTRALQLALLVGGGGGLLFLGLNTLTEGGFFYNIVTANANAFGWDRLIGHLEQLVEDAGILLALGLLFLLAGWKTVKGWALMGPFLVGGTLSALTIGKIGSNINYFLELAAALSLVGGAVVAWSRRQPWRNSLVLVLLSIQIGFLVKSTMDVQVDWILTPRRNDIVALQRLEQVVLDLKDPIPADEYMSLLTQNGRPLYIQPFEVSQLANDGKWDQSPFLADIANQAFEGILIHHFGPYPVYKERWTPEMLAAIEANYRPAKTLAGTVIFLPAAETEISRAPKPAQNTTFTPDDILLGPLQTIGKGSHWSQPDIAVNPNYPDHIAAIATRSSLFDCEPPNCKVELLLYFSTDGGDTWTQGKPFSKVNSIFHNGMVDFDAQDNLYAFGTRDNTLDLNRANLSADYQMEYIQHQDITSAQVQARPQFRVKPETGQVFVTLDAQEEDRLFVTPSLLRSEDAGDTWSATSRADLRVSVADFSTGRATWPDDIQVLFGGGSKVSLVWTWGWEPWTWPRTVWMANSTDGGATFGEPASILETWAPVRATSANGIMAIAYRSGTEERQALAVATSSDNGKSWYATAASGEVPLFFDSDHSPGLGIAPNGTIDLVFYAHDPGSVEPDSNSCLLDLGSWLEVGAMGRVDPCTYNLFYTFSKDGGVHFSDPIQLNPQPIEGEDLARFQGRTTPGSHLAVASSDGYAYPAWIATLGREQTELVALQISR